MSIFCNLKKLNSCLFALLLISLWSCNDESLLTEVKSSAKSSQVLNTEHADASKQKTYPFRYTFTEYENQVPARISVYNLEYDSKMLINRIIREDSRQGIRIYKFDKDSAGLLTRQTVSENGVDQYYYAFTYTPNILGVMQISNIKAYTMEGTDLGVNIEYDYSQAAFKSYTFSLGNDLQYSMQLEGRGDAMLGKKQTLTLNGEILYKTEEDLVYNEQIKHPHQFNFLGVLSYLPYEEMAFPLENIAIAVMPVTHLTFVTEGNKMESSLLLYEYGELNVDGFPISVDVFKTNLEKPGQERTIVRSIYVDYR